MALLPPAGRAPDVPDRAEVVVTASGYEAAAELLAAPAAALLLDLGRITDVHRPLLTMAGRLKIPVVAFGAVRASMSGEWLAGLHLATRASAAEVLSSVLGEAPAEGTAAEAGQEAAAAGRSLAPPQAEYKPADAEAPSAAGAEAPPPRPRHQPARPAGLLTDDELKALLGGDS